MNNSLTTQMLQDYVDSLERELKAKSIEQQTLYRALEASEKELSTLDQLYFFKTVLTNEVATLKSQLEMANQERAQMTEAFKELEWARGEIVRLSNGLRAKDFQQQSQLQEVYEENEELLNRVKSLQSELSQEKSQQDVFRCQMKQLEFKLQTKKKDIHRLEEQLQTLGENYIKVEQAFFQKDHYIQELKEQNQELHSILETLKQQMGQKNIMITCLESQLEEARQTYRNEPQSSMKSILENIDKLDLIKQTNSLVERVHIMQRQNRGIVMKGNPKLVSMQTHLANLKQEFQALSTNLQL